MLIPSIPETSGFRIVIGLFSAVPFCLKKYCTGPAELKSSLVTVCELLNGGARYQGTAPTEIVSCPALWPLVVIR